MTVSDTVKITVNGANMDAHGSDTLPFRSRFGRTAYPPDGSICCFFGTAISGLAALLVGVFGSDGGTAIQGYAKAHLSPVDDANGGIGLSRAPE